MSRLPLAIALALGGLGATFFVAVMSGAKELGGQGSPAWLDVVGFGLSGLTGLLLFWVGILSVRWLMLRVSHR